MGSDHLRVVNNKPSEKLHTTEGEIQKTKVEKSEEKNDEEMMGGDTVCSQNKVWSTKSKTTASTVEGNWPTLR